MASQDQDWEFEKTVIPSKVRSPASAQTSQLCLRVTHSTGEQTYVQLTDKPVVVGRLPDCDVTIPSSSVSRRHAEFRLLENSVLMSDLGSTNGSYIDGDRITDRAVLSAGQFAEIGPVRFSLAWHTAEELVVSQQVQEDLERASNYVVSQLPQRVASGPVVIDWAFQPSMALGGDIFGYHMINDTEAAVYLIDVTGHGVGAAMHSTTVCTTIRRGALPNTDFGDPGQVLTRLNEYYPMEEHDNNCFTIWYGVYDFEKRQLRFGVGGHHPAYILLPDGGPQPVGHNDPLIGAIPNHVYATDTISVKPGSALMLFSDGAFEFKDRGGQRSHLNSVLSMLSYPAQAPETAARRLFAQIDDVRETGPWEDDCSILALKIA